MNKDLKDLIEKEKERFKKIMSDAYGLNDGYFLHEDVLSSFESSLLSAFQKALDMVEKGLPEKADEGKGWDIVPEQCCPGDDAAAGFNTALIEVRQSIEKLRNNQ